MVNLAMPSTLCSATISPIATNRFDITTVDYIVFASTVVQAPPPCKYIARRRFTVADWLFVILICRCNIFLYVHSFIVFVHFILHSLLPPSIKKTSSTKDTNIDDINQCRFGSCYHLTLWLPMQQLRQSAH
jgi:hypothetical protein